MNRPRPRLRRLRRGIRIGLTLSLLGFGLAGLAPTVAAASPASAEPSAPSAQQCASDNLAPSSRTVTPVRVTQTTGDVSNATAVLRGRQTTLSGAGASVTLDFGKEVGGLISLRFTGANTSGQQLGLAFSESSQYIGPDSDSSNGGSGSDGAIYASVAPNTSWTMPDASLRGGFRYLTLFADTAGPISLGKVTLAISFAPDMTNLRAYDNYFCSSDPLLNRIWYAGAYTVETDTISPTTGRVWGPPASGWNNSATVGVGSEVLVDGAKRDRTVWPGDLGISLPTEYASLGDLTPTRNALTTLYDHQAASGELPYAGPEVNFYGSDTYHMWTLIGTATYYQYSHDKAWLDGEWSNYQRAVAYSLAEVGSDGLMTVQGTADWGRSDQGGENLEANALLYETLTTGAQLAQVENDGTDAANWAAAATAVQNAINADLWDAAAGEYRDNPTSDLYPQDGNSLALWYGIAPADRAQQVSAALTTDWNAYGATTPEDGGDIATFAGSMEVMAHLAAGDTTQALDLMRTEWGYMLDSPLGTGSTFWEGYLANGQFGYGGPYMSNSHGWATGPTSALTFYVLGIRPTTVDGGYDIEPQTGNLSDTDGSLSTPFGDIKVAWTHNVRSATFTEQISAPASAVDEIDVPTYGAPTLVTVNGRAVWNGGRSLAYGAHLENGYVVLTGAPKQASIVSRAVGSVPTTLSVANTSTSNTPVLPGQSVTLPVTVSASGDKVVDGTVTATVPQGWTAQPASFKLDTRDGPQDTVVDVTVTAPASVTTGGEQTITLAASADGQHADTTTQLLSFGSWPAGTTATASSAHDPNIYNGQTRTYYASNAIDGNLATFWNNANSGQFPDTLTVTAPSAVTLDGVGFASIVDGVPTDFEVQTWNGTAWVTSAQVSGNSSLYLWIPFTTPVTTTQVQVVVTASQPQNGNYARIAELTP